MSQTDQLNKQTFKDNWNKVGDWLKKYARLIALETIPILFKLQELA